VPARAAGFGYAEDSDYEKLTRKQRKEATRFTHKFGVVAVTTQPRGTGKSQTGEWYEPSLISDGQKERVRQVGSSGRAVPRRATDGDKVHPFNRAALQARTMERGREAKPEAENELAMQRQRGYGSGTNGTATDRYIPSLPGMEDAQQASEDVRQALRRKTALSMGCKPSDVSRCFKCMFDRPVDRFRCSGDGDDHF
jgi:hypothetical protein